MNHKVYRVSCLSVYRRRLKVFAFQVGMTLFAVLVLPLCATAAPEFLAEPQNTLRELEVHMARLQNGQAVPPELRGAIETVLLAEDDVNVGNYISARARVDSLLAQYPYTNQVWNGLYYFARYGNTSSEVTSEFYCNLRMLDEITRVALNGTPTNSTTLNVTVVLQRYARYQVPPAKGGGTITAEISQNPKTDNFYAYRQVLNLFSHYVSAMTDGEVKFNIRFYELQSTIDYTLNTATNELKWYDYGSFVSQLPQQIRDSTDQFFAFYPRHPTDARLDGINIVDPGGQGTVVTSPYNRMILMGPETAYYYVSYMNRRQFGPAWTQHEFHHYLDFQLFPEYNLEPFMHSYFDFANWPVDFVQGLANVRERDYYAESLKRRFRGSVPSMAARLKGAPSRQVVNTGNRAPVVNAGSDLNVPLTATLDGTVTDADNNPLLTSWSLVSGPDVVTFGDSTVVDTTATFRKAGTYRLRLTADDGLAQTNDDVVVTVTSSLPSVTWTTACQSSLMESNTLTATAQLSASYSQAVTVPFTLSGTATQGVDYALSTNAITIPAGSTSGSVTITILADTVVEDYEYLTLIMDSPVNATLGTTVVHTAWITDDEGVTIPPPAPGPGSGITREWWSGISGTAIANLTGNASYPNTPSLRETVAKLFETPSSLGDNYGQRLHGYFIAPVTGNYRFYIASDDTSELWLSTNVTTAGAINIASVSVWTNSREWGKYGSQKSAAIALVAGQRYYIGALHKEGTGGDHLAVGVEYPNGSVERPIPFHRLDPWPSVAWTSYAQSSANESGSLTVTAQLSSVSPQTVTVPFTVTGTASGADYSISANPITIPAGATTGSITIAITNDLIQEANDETVILTLGTPTNAALGAIRVHTATITDDDNTAPAVYAGADYSVPLSSGAPWSPSQLGPQLWIDATTATLNAGTVTVNNAGSGGGFLSGPASLTNGINALQTVRFTGGSQRLNGSYTNTGTTLTAFFVGKATTSSQNPWTGMMSIWQTGMNWDYNNSGSAVLFGQNGATQNSIYTQRGGGLSSTNGALTNAFLVTTLFDSSMNTLFLNGTPADSVASSGSFDAANVVLGCRWDVSFSKGWNGNLGEAIICNANLSTSDRQKIEGYLAHKWGLTNSLPAGHPYKSAAPRNCTVNLDGTVSDGDNNPLTTAWTLVSGPAPVTFGSASALDTTATLSAIGTYTFRLTANDGYGPVSDDVVITVTSGSPQPVVAWTTSSQTSTNESGTLTVTARLSATSASTVTVPFTVSGTATNTDRSVSASPIVIAPGATNGSVTITITTDTLIETNESVILTMGTPTNAALGATQVHTATITDDDVTVNTPPVVTAGTNQTVTLGVQIPWTPADIACAAWYDASTATINAGTVSVINAGSGGGTISGPATLQSNGIGTLQTVRLSGTNQYLVGNYVNTGTALSALFVGKQTVAGQVAYASPLTVWANGRVNDWDNTNSAVLLSQNNATANSIYSHQTKALSSTNSTLTVPFLAGSFFSGSAHTLYLNGAPANSVAIASSFNTDKVMLGARWQGSTIATPYWNGQWGEVIICNTILSISDRQKLEGYLAHKWGVTNSLSAGHPYKTNAPVVGTATAMVNLAGLASDADGDSLTTTWSVVSPTNAGVNFGNAAVTNTTATFTSAGTYVLRLTASDTYTQVVSQVTITITNAVTQYTIMVSAPSKGTITPSGAVTVAEGGSTNFVITPDAHYSITSVTTNGAAVTISNPAGFTYTWSNVRASGTLAALFQRTRTLTNSVPTEWLATAVPSSTNNFEAAAAADPDNDGYTTAQEYWSGTDPMNASSYLKFDSIELSGTNALLTWSHARVDAGLPPITIQARTNLVSGTWGDLGAKAPTNGVNTWSPSSSVQGFYRLTATNAP